MATTDYTDLDLRYLSHAALALPGDGALYYDDRGDGPVLTFINNFYIVSPVWRNFTNQLQERNRLVTYDLRNQGASTSGQEQLHFRDHCDDLRRLLDHLSIERTYLVGTSISTLIARDFALTYPDRVKGLVLVGPAFSPNGTLRRELISRDWLSTVESGRTKALFDKLYPLVFSDQAIHAGGTAAYLALRENFLALLSVSSIRENLVASMEIDDSPARLSELSCPTLIIIGDGDFAWSQSVVNDACSIIADCRGVIVPRAGHLPYFEDPDAFQLAVQDFIDAVENSSGRPGTIDKAVDHMVRSPAVSGKE